MNNLIKINNNYYVLKHIRIFNAILKYAFKTITPIRTNKCVFINITLL